MSRATMGSRIGSLFIRIFLIASWALLILSLALAMLLTIWPNIWNNEEIGSFGVWKLSKNTLTTSLSNIGIFLICISSVAIVFSMIIQLIMKKVKFKIGKNNQVLGYFSSIAFPLIVFVVFAFVGSMNFPSLKVPGIASNYSLFYTPAGFALLIKNASFPLAVRIDTTTWIWWIFLIFGFFTVIGVLFTTIKIIIKTLFSKTHAKDVIAQ